MTANLEKLIDDTANDMGPRVVSCLTEGGAIRLCKQYLTVFAKQISAELEEKKES